jgi:4-phospho-D-threonate 3-dehydrogenase / 4-phospho-D-erythronate 3-dehydrogenase
MKSKPIIGISMGDPAGIGPEIIAKALSRENIHQICRPLVVGDPAIMERATGFARVELAIHRIARTSEALFQPAAIDVLALDGIDLCGLSVGSISAKAGDAAFRAVRKVVELALAGEIEATVTAPIHKEALVRAGHHFPGHTEIFAHFTSTRDFTMMLATQNFRVVHVSTHMSLRDACNAVTRDRVLKVINLAHEGCRQLGIANPRIGVAGLNPHAGDGGLFGTEETDHIIPAIKDARAIGFNVDGPHPPDTFFAKAMSGIYDICVAMYHDQGHIPVKIRGFHFDPVAERWDSVNGINVSLGMPIIRASVDHGTAFDQAGKGTASDASLVDAIEYASKMAANR